MTDHDTADPVEEPQVPDGPKASHRLRWISLGVVVVGLAVAGGVAWKQVKPVVDSRRYSSVTEAVPTAPKLTATDGETIYRIDPAASSLTYEIDETFAGRKTSTATGATSGIAGDLAVNPDDLAASRVGDIVVNVEQFHSDNNLRDARIRQDFLESHRYPLATFSVDDLKGLSGKLTEGKTYTFTMTGQVTLKDTPANATWKVRATLDHGRLEATATTSAKLSRFKAGPISIAGLVHTSDDVKLTLKLSAVDPADNQIATKTARPEAVQTAATDASPSYAKVIEPIIEKSCASCHNTGQMAGAHVRLDTAADVKAISDGIKTVTQTGYMPPWPASDKGVKLAHNPKLSAADLAALAQWSDAGGQLDVPAKTPVTMTAKAAALQPRKDVSMRVPAYAGSLDNVNDYRCFVLDPKITKDTYLTGYTFIADQVEELHHAQVFQISDEQLAYSETKGGADGKPGWSCYGGPDLLGRRPDRVPGQPRKRGIGFTGQPNLVAGWVPGQSPVLYPKGTGMLLHKGDALVLQLHYHYGDKPVPDRSGLALQLDEPSAAIKGIRVVNPIGPVEIPCAPKDAKAPLCDREASLEDNVKRFGPFGANNEAGLLSLCNRTPEELAATFDGTVASSSCTYTVPEDGVILGAMGHMHTLGKTFRFTLNPGTKDSKILLDIPTWSFNWQMNYGLETPLHVKAGDKLLMECSWDRSVDPLREPKYIVFAEGTEDEMCFGTYSLLPDDQ